MVPIFLEAAYHCSYHVPRLSSGGMGKMSRKKVAIDSGVAWLSYGAVGLVSSIFYLVYLRCGLHGLFPK